MENARHRKSFLVGALVAVAAASPAPSLAAPPDINGATDFDGAVFDGFTASELSGLESSVHNAADASHLGPWYKYASTSYCSVAPPGSAGTSQPSCTAEFAVCNLTGAANTTRGPAVWVWRQQVDRTGRPVPGAQWERIDYTCLSSLVPGATSVLTMQMIFDEFHKTAFARPTASIQPVGLKTLVNLPTYFELKWPAAGFAPNEVDTTTLVGRRVEIRPTFQNATYIFGDGQAVGPTSSHGGPHPTGDVIHTYRKAAVAPVQVNVTYGGQFRVDGGAWVTIPDTVTIEGTPVNLTVAEAKARLYRN